jgi:hypothetical protein
VDPDRILENASPTISRALELTDRHGHQVVVVVAKLTFAVSASGEASIAVPPSPVRFYAEPYDGRRGIRFPDDIAEEKPGTDVLLVGHAVAPAATKATAMEVRLRVGELASSVRVVGPRYWLRNARDLVPGPSAPLVRTPLASDLGFGAAEPVASDPAPVIEDPERPGEPATLGAVGADSPSRSKYLGTMDAAWSRERAPILPTDFDPRYYTVASAGLWSATPLLGDEPVEVVGATPSGRWMFKLPRFAPRFFAQERRSEAQELDTHLDTFLVDADAGRVELTWRAKIRLPAKAVRLERIAIVQGWPLPTELYRRALQELDRDDTTTKETTA